MRWKWSLLILLLLIIPGVFFFLSRTKQQSISQQVPLQQSSGPNLASILIAASPSATIVLTDAQGKNVGTSFVQQGIRPPDLPSGTPSPMGDLREFTLQQPQDGSYIATITLVTSDEVVFYLYDKLGKVTVDRMMQQAGTSRYVINFTTNGESKVTKQ